jgi:hypothetical protein
MSFVPILKNFAAKEVHAKTVTKTQRMNSTDHAICIAL